MAYALKLNGAASADKYTVKLEEKDSWENKFWGINGDKTKMLVDPKRKGKLTLQFFGREDGKCYNVFASIDNQGHECREHTCENAWLFMSCFSRDKDGKIFGGELEQIEKVFQ